MISKPQSRDAFELFQSHFDQLLDPGHELIQLANKIDGAHLDAAFVDCYRPDIGAPANAIRLMVGLHYLKYAFNESDESVVDRWVENPYWQYFCGYTHMQHVCPIHPASMTKWRNRVGVDRLEELLKETIALAVREKHLPKNDLRKCFKSRLRIDIGMYGTDAIPQRCDGGSVETNQAVDSVAQTGRASARS